MRLKRRGIGLLLRAVKRPMSVVLSFLIYGILVGGEGTFF